ncbi:MAG TPA: transcriptional regulator, partial [Pseudonocardiaceae bacterium]
SQQKLIDLSGLAKATITELRKNKEGRKHGIRTLKDMSVALDWHPGHLLAVLQGRTPPELGETVAPSDGDIPGRLDVIERRLDQIFDRLDKVDALDGRFDGLVAEIETAVQRVMLGRRRPGH